MADYESDNTPAVIDRAAVTTGPGEPHTEPATDGVADDSPEAGIEALRRQIAESEARVRAAEQEREAARSAREAERAAREEAEQRAAQYQREADHTRRSANDAQYDSVINALAAAQGELASQKNALKSAMAEGDFDRVAELSAEIGLTAARVREFEAGKQAMEARRHDGQQQMPGDAREAYLRSRTPRTAAWLRRNDRFFTDRRFQNAVTGAHMLAENRGIEPDSDEYFQFIEEQVGLRQAQQPQQSHQPQTSAAAATSPRQSPMTAAPAQSPAIVSARAQAAAGTVSLSPEERELCRRDGISEAAYAKHKAELLREGRIGIGH